MFNDTPKKKIDLENEMSKTPPFVTTLIILLIAVYLWQKTNSSLTSANDPIILFSLNRDAVMHGQIWRIISCLFLHANWDHLTGNCIALYIAGTACEHIYGSKYTFLGYSLSGIIGSIFSLLFTQNQSIGASGAIMGVFTFISLTLFLNQDHFISRNKNIYIAFFIWTAYILWQGTQSIGVDNMAHLGGALGGILCTLLWQEHMRK